MNEAVVLHSEHGNSTGHLFGATIGAQPLQILTNDSGQFRTIVVLIGCDQVSNMIHLLRGKKSSAISMRMGCYQRSGHGG